MSSNFSRVYYFLFFSLLSLRIFFSIPKNIEVSHIFFCVFLFSFGRSLRNAESVIVLQSEYWNTMLHISVGKNKEILVEDFYNNDSAFFSENL